MLKFRVVLFSFLVILSCNCQKKVKNDSEKVSNKIESDYIAALLQEKNFKILEQADLVIDYDITKKLLPGTKDEYSNKLILNDTISQAKTRELLSFLKRDTSYEWKAVPNEVQFEPKKQLLIKSETGRLTLMIDEGYKRMSFINLDGQKMVNLAEEFSSFFKKM